MSTEEKQLINTKLTEQEIQTLKDYQLKINNLMLSLGEIELQVSNLDLLKKQQLSSYEELKKNQNDTAKILQLKYGDGNINLETGEFTQFIQSN